MFKKKYKHLFFDLDNTLFDFDACAKLSLKECYNKNNLSQWFADFEEFNVLYAENNIRLWQAYKNNEVKKDEVKFGRFRQTLEAKEEKNEPLIEALAEDFLLFCTHQNILVDGALPIVEELHKKYKMYVISNGFIEVQHKKMELTGLAPYFKRVVLSEQVKAQKPSRAIFEYAVKSANARKFESIMIGDNIDADIQGAKNFGIDQIYFDCFLINGNSQHAFM